jgi:hypothetical protein
MATLTVPPTAAAATPDEPSVGDTARWRWAGALGLAHVVLLFTAFSVEKIGSVTHGTSPTEVARTLGGVPMTRLELSTYLEAVSFLPLVAALALLARLLGRRTETGRVAGQAALGIGVAYGASTFATGFPPLTAAAYGAHHGIDPGTLTMLNDVRNYAFVLQVALMAASALALGVAALAERSRRVWAGYAGVAVGVGGLVATPFAHNAVSMVWMVWWVGLSVLALRGTPRTGTPADR